MFFYILTRMKMLRFCLSLCILCFGVICSGGNKIQLSQQNFFAGQKSQFTLKSPKLTGAVTWTLSFFGRFSQAGRTVVKADGALIQFKAPNLSPGGAVKGKFSLRSSSAKLTFSIYLYSQKPFTNKAEFNKLKIIVWNIEQESNWVEKLLKQNRIKFKKTDSFDDLDGNLLLLSGLDFADFSGVAEDLFQWCRHGKRVIFFAPMAGNFPFPGKTFNEFTFLKASAIQRFNKKFDLLPVASSFSLKAIDDALAMSFSKQTNGYSFCRVKYGKGEIIFCGWDIKGQLSVKPAALYVFKMLLNNKYN